MLFYYFYSRPIIQRLEQAVTTDPLTNIANKNGFSTYLNKAKLQTRRNNFPSAVCKSRQSALLFIDVNKFKQINDRFGHHIGDLVLTELSLLLKDNIRPIDMVARWGGDEFVILLYEGGTRDAVISVCKRLNQQIQNTTFLDSEGAKISIAVSIGIHFVSSFQECEEAVLLVDKAMYQAKHNNLPYCFYENCDTPLSKTQPLGDGNSSFTVS